MKNSRDSFKFRINGLGSVLNLGGQSGRRLRNSLRTLRLIFSVTESTIQYFTDRDNINSTVAGLVSGALCKVAGAKVGCDCGSLRCIAAAARKRKYVPILG
ncbi:hypothetical protein AAHE18_09G107200 [Arachis hypogaea]